MNRIDRWLFAAGSAHSLACARVVLASALALRVALGPYRGLTDRPDALFDPPPVLEWLGSVPSAWVIVAVQVVGFAAAVAAVLGWRPRTTFALAWVALLFLGGLRDSFGKILHNDVLLLLVCLPFLVAPLGVRLGDRTRRSAYGFALRAGLLIAGAAYLFCGIQKLRHSGIDWVTSDNMRWIMDGAARSARSPAPDLARLIADTPWLATVLAAAVLGLELTFVLCVPVVRLRPLVLVAAVGLHVGTALLLGIDYWGWIAADAAVLVSWDRFTVNPFRPQPAEP